MEIPFPYEEIIKILYCRHSIGISFRTLLRTLRKKKRLYRRDFPSPLVDVITYIEKKMSSIGFCVGHQAMHQRCIRNGYKGSKKMLE